MRSVNGLTSERVHLIRVSGMTDRHWERVWRISSKIIRNARVGRTWRDHPTPVDNKPRSSSGRRSSPEARFLSAGSASISRALLSWRAPSSDNGDGNRG